MKHQIFPTIPAQTSNDIGYQVAALPLRRNAKSGKLEVLMVTTRGTGRWVIPKGWPMKGKTSSQAAELEAFEEAGLKGAISSDQLSSFHYLKINDSSARWIKVDVFPMIAEKLKKRWKERAERKRRWFSLKSAAKRVHEPELAEILLRLSDESKSPLSQDILKALK